MRRQTLFLLFMILFSLPLTVLAQGTKTVKGTVVDQNNEPIIGATVVVKGSTIGAATDLDGNYVLNGVPEDATLVFNYLGMLPQEISDVKMHNYWKKLLLSVTVRPRRKT